MNLVDGRRDVGDGKEVGHSFCLETPAGPPMAADGV